MDPSIAIAGRIIATSRHQYDRADLKPLPSPKWRPLGAPIIAAATLLSVVLVIVNFA